MLIYLHVIFVACSITYEEVTSKALNFSRLLVCFQNCSVTFHHIEILRDGEGPWHQNHFDEVFFAMQNLALGTLLQVQVDNLHTTTGTTFKGSASTANYTKKHAECTVYIFLRRILSEKLIPKSRSWTQAEFTWFLHFKQSSSKQPSNIYYILKHFKLPAIYLEILNFLQVTLICIPCSRKSSRKDNDILPMLDPEGFQSPMQIRERWLWLNANMYRIIVILPSDLINSTQKSDDFSKGHITCTLLSSERSPFIEAHRCIAVVLREPGNVSVLRWVSEPQIGIHEMISESNLLSWRMNERSVIVHGMKSDDYGYIVLYGRKLANSQVVLKMKLILIPFVWWGWATILLLSLAISALLAVHITGMSISSVWKETIHLYFPLTSLLLDQPSRAHSYQGTATKELTQMALWFIWGLFCILVSNTYKGSLFSSLSFVETPAFPHSLRELIENGMLIGSTACYKQDKLRLSTLTDNLLPEIITATTDAFSRKMYAALKDSLVWFTNADLVSFANQTSSIGVTRVNFTLSKLPTDKFSVIDTFARIVNLKNYLEELRVFWVSKPVPLEPVFASRSFWSVEYNYFFPTFSRSLANAHELGLFNRWENLKDIKHSKSPGKVKRKKVLNTKHRRRNYVEQKLHARGISKWVYFEVLVNFSAFVKVCAVIFCFEVLWRRLTRFSFDIVVYFWILSKICGN